MIYDVRHTTRYRYSAPVTLCHSEARLLPRQLDWQCCEASQLAINPAPAVQAEHRDFFGNRVLYFAIQEIHREFEVTVRTRFQSLPRPALPGKMPTWEICHKALDKRCYAEALEARQFRLDSPFVKRNAELAAYAAESFTPGRSLLEAVQELNRRIFEEFVYDPAFTTLATPLTEVLAERRGVCQDFAHLAIGCLRSIGLAARYVSGYLETQPPAGQPRLIGADASHAWCSVFLPGWGWLDIDPTNGNLPGERHLVIGWGRDYADVAPLKGVMNGGGEHSLQVEVDVIPESERLATRPAAGTAGSEY
ncbi:MULTISPECIES: transglutaminase family protein [Halomonadaceae]|uniref:transglutaminase family protein n=1 Tax=Halomonadaceae TaxID=28256 RepID=UPI00159AABE9|nr:MULTISPECIES: transglutaminase family protein [unclassified Halomonas]QJQ94691.1 transglutaminase family protein [Halomonas sp. PA5]